MRVIVDPFSSKDPRKPFMEGEQPSVQPEHQVFLREGTIVLHWLFGYYNKRCLQVLDGATRLRWPHTLSTWTPRKPKTKFREATLVSIDIDELKEQDGFPVQFDIGISILPTQDLHDQCYLASLHAQSAPYRMRSYHWAVGTSDYYSTRPNRFCFGKRRCIPLSDLKERLKTLLGKSSPIILIVHGGHRKVTILKKLDIDLNPIFTIDTTKAARYPHQAFYDYTLKKLLQDFGIPFTNKQLHVAGNDAHFTLRVLLMIAVADVRRELDQVPIWVPVFEAIARAPLPPKPLKHAEKAAVIKRNGLAATEQEKMALYV
jgi:hypothetical protein